MLYQRPGERKFVFFIIYGVTKAYSFIYSKKHSKQQKKKEYVLVCHPYVIRMWFYHEPKKRATSKSTFTATKYVQNVIKLKQNFLNNIFQYFSNFFQLSLRYYQFHLCILSKDLKVDSFPLKVLNTWV